MEELLRASEVAKVMADQTVDQIVVSAAAALSLSNDKIRGPLATALSTALHAAPCNIYRFYTPDDLHPSLGVLSDADLLDAYNLADFLMIPQLGPALAVTAAQREFRKQWSVLPLTPGQRESVAQIEVRRSQLSHAQKRVIFAHCAAATGKDIGHNCGAVRSGCIGGCERANYAAGELRARELNAEFYTPWRASADPAAGARCGPLWPRARRSTGC
jgi:hypothetical protein